MSNEVATITENTEIATGDLSLFDPTTFEQIERVAAVMARASMIPDHLKGKEFEETMANCFMVASQAQRWSMDPLAVAQHTSVVHGKLMYEGKLVAAALDKVLGVSLDYEYNDKEGDDFGIVVSGAHPRTGKIEKIEGTVGEWKTSEKGGATKGPWRGASNQRCMLHYRGTREWARLHASSVMLGVYTPDEFDDDEQKYRASRARDITEGSMADRYKVEDKSAPERDEQADEPKPAETEKAAEGNDTPEKNGDSDLFNQDAAAGPSSDQAAEQGGESTQPADSEDSPPELDGDQKDLLKRFAMDIIRIVKADPSRDVAGHQTAVKTSKERWKTNFDGQPEHVMAAAGEILRYVNNAIKGEIEIDEAADTIDTFLS